MKYILLLLTTLLLHSAASADMRYWRQNDGSVIEGEYLSQKLGNAYFKTPERKTVSIVVADLVPSDLAYIETMAPPEVDIKVKVDLEPEEGEYKDPHKQFANAKITLKKVGKKTFNGTLNAELYLVRKEIAQSTPNMYRILTKRTVKVKFPDGKKPSAVFDLSAIVRYWDIKGEERGWDYEGYLIVLLDQGGEVLQTRSDLRWLDDEELKRFREFEPYFFFDGDCKKKSTPRPRFIDVRTM